MAPVTSNLIRSSSLLHSRFALYFERNTPDVSLWGLVGVRFSVHK